MIRTLFSLAVAALSLTILPLPARAVEGLKFCTKCRSFYLSVSNQSGAVVRKVKVTQLASDKCTEVTKVHKKKLPLGKGFDVYPRDGCAYKFRFYTTAGCIGDKSGTLTLKDRQEGKKRIWLKGTCFGLKVRINAPP